MAKDYSKNVATAKRLIEKFGQSLTFTQYPDNVSGYDEDGNVVAPGASTTVDGHGVKLNYEKGDIDGKNVITGDCQCLFAPDSGEGEIEVGMEVTLDGEVWRVVDTGALQPASVIIMYQIQLRQ